jgi:hypothetical protein
VFLVLVLVLVLENGHLDDRNVETSDLSIGSSLSLPLLILLSITDIALYKFVVIGLNYLRLSEKSHALDTFFKFHCQ